MYHFENDEISTLNDFIDQSIVINPNLPKIILFRRFWKYFPNVLFELLNRNKFCIVVTFEYVVFNKYVKKPLLSAKFELLYIQKSFNNIKSIDIIR